MKTRSHSIQLLTKNFVSVPGRIIKTSFVWIGIVAFFQCNALHICGNVIAFKSTFQLLVFEVIRIDLRLNPDKLLFFFAAIAFCGKYNHAAAYYCRDRRKFEKTAVEQAFFRLRLSYFRLWGFFSRLSFFCQLFSRSLSFWIPFYYTT